MQDILSVVGIRLRLGGICRVAREHKYRPDAMSDAADPNEVITEQEFVRPAERGLHGSQ